MSSEYTDGLRAVAEWLDAHPHYLPMARDFPVFFYGDSATEALASFARELGHAEERSIGPFVEVRRSFGPHSISGIAEREQPAPAPDAAAQDLRGGGRQGPTPLRPPLGDITMSTYPHQAEEERHGTTGIH